MKRTIYLAALLLLACRAWGGYANTVAGRAAYFGPLRTYIAGLGTDFTLGTVGDSWTSNAQQSGETQAWVASLAYAQKNPIWADPTASHATTWTNRLAWRLKTRRFMTEAVGGAPLATAGATFAYAADSSICGWVDEVAAFNPDVVIGYGGINNINSVTALAWSNLRPMAYGFAALLRSSFPATVPIIIPTLQPCGKIVLYSKYHAVSGYSAKTWTQIGDLALANQVNQFKFNTYLKDTLKVELKAAGIDTSMIFVYDQFEALAADPTRSWLTARDPALYSLVLGDGTTGLPKTVTVQGDPATDDSLKWYALRFVRPEIESDSIHVIHKGLRQIADSMAVNVFGIDLATWEAPAAATIYANKQTGNNWTNRLVATNPATPLATLQAAIWKAFPGDSIYVSGTGNQALIKASDGYSVSGNELRITHPDLRIGFAAGAYYDGQYTATGSRGAGWLDANLSTGGDGKELPSTIAEWPSTAVGGVNYPRIDLNLRMTGLRTRGYQAGIVAQNISGVTLTDCVLKGGSAASGALLASSYGDTLTWNLTRCTFYVDSNTVTDVAGAVGSLTLKTAATSPADSTRDIASRYLGTIKNCYFYGDSLITSTAAVTGYIDGLVWVGNTFDDPVPSSGGWMACTRTTGSTSDIKLLHNTFDMNTAAVITVFRASETTNALIDSVIICGNLLFNHGTALSASTSLYYGPNTAARAWYEGNIFPTTARAIRNGEGTSQSIANLVSAGSAATGRNWYCPVSYTGDTVRFGGRPRYLFHNTAAKWYGLATYGISTALRTASIGATQLDAAQREPFVWPSTPSLETSTNRVGDTPQDLLNLIDAGVLFRSDSLDIDTWYRFPSVRSFAEEAQVKAYLNVYYDWTEANRKKIRWYISGSRYLVKAHPDSTNFQSLMGPWGAAKEIYNDGDLPVSSPTDPTNWIRFQIPRNAGERLQLDYYLKTWEQWPDTLQDSLFFKIDGMSNAVSYLRGVGSAASVWVLLAAIPDPETAVTDNDASTWFSFYAPRNESEMMMANIHTAEWNSLATDDKAKIKLKSR